MNTYKNNNLFWKSMILKKILYAVRISALITILLIIINRIFMSDKKIIFTYSEITLLLIVIVLFIISELIHYVIMCFSLYGETANVINYMYFPKVKLKTIKNMKSSIAKDRAVTQDELIDYYKKHYKLIIYNPVWRQEAIVYYWINEFDGMELCALRFKYVNALLDTYINQNRYIYTITDRINHLLIEREGYSWMD